ncbi:G-D-S-L family lipolytic protein [Flavivirga aquatica]|uniref:G-D-S-L family lipolytic protein n=1 Tax=Flavivirga aquatica TaxID=1849968 RepID=A0A1E5TDE0_9FLAO|nr:G-D-S-L family lipolytic protein [Flavivirga aquatica]OEK09385.1 G-D-S-L family lipolytic protein [Flavivirga aquatica]
MNNIKYILLFVLLIGFYACNEDDNILPEETVLPELTTGTADFSNYVALGASFTAGFTDGALFRASQENSFPNILSKEFAKLGNDTFTLPLMNDNIGGLLIGGTANDRFTPRLYFYSDQDDTDNFSSGPYPLGVVPHKLDFTAEIPTTEATTKLNGTFSNMGIPGAKSFHLLFDGYGNPANLATATANPYFVRIASNSTATILGDAIAQNPTFFTLSEIGGNDVLGYATSGGDGSNLITDASTFNSVFNTLITTLTSTGAKGVITNVPYITDLPHFTTVPYNPLSPLNPNFGPQIPTLNNIFGALNQVFDVIDPSRKIVFSQTAASPVVIHDETLPNIATLITGALNTSPTFPTFVESLGLPIQASPLIAGLLGKAYGQSRQATEKDLLVLPSSSIIGTTNQASVSALMAAKVPQQLAEQFSAEGITLPLADKWVLLPSELKEINNATDAYNATIKSVIDSNDNIALVDLNNILAELASAGINFDNFSLKSNLVTGGAISLDGIHLTGRGYAYMANKFLEAIDAKFGSNFVASGNVANANDYPTNYSSEP